MATSKKTIIHIDNILAQRYILMEQAKSFDVVLSGSTRKIIYENTVYQCSPHSFLPDDLRFIKKVKNEIIARCEVWEKENKIGIEELKCSYINYRTHLPFDCSNVVEVDLNSAFWVLAFDLGYISEETYREGLKVKKKVRLAALGSVAKTEKTIRYVNGVYEDSFAISPKFRKVFFNISRYVYEVMDICKALLGEDYLFFWVDAIFFKDTEENRRLVLETIAEAGLESKLYEIQKFSFEQKESIITVESEGHKNYKRKFNISKNNGF